MTQFFHLLRILTQPLYRIKGMGFGRLCEFVRLWAARRARSTPYVIKNFRGNASFRCFLQEHMGGQIFFKGSYSGDQLTLVERFLPKDGVFIDVGANQGEFSITAARVVTQGKVIAFEPVSEYRERLQANIHLNQFENVQVVASALGEQEGCLPIYDQPGNAADGTRNEGLPTLFVSGSRSNPVEIVVVSRLDDVLKDLGISRVDVIKLDIEGAEWMALRGAVETLASCRPILILEIGRETCLGAGYEPEALVDWLTSQGYRVEKIMDNSKTVPLTLSALGDFQNVVAYPI
ncbi:MAG: FkbM family methyltransferase [Rhodoferax sp.]|nr:FkbM family methyltransferase [Rhodoferax sp.]